MTSGKAPPDVPLSRVALLAGAAILAVWGGCSIYNASLLLPSPTDGGDSADNGTDVQSDRASPAPTCKPVTWPGPPSTQDDDGVAGDDDAGTVSAVRNLSLGIPSDGGIPAPRGYDLDNTCTCPGPDSCSSSFNPHCDDDAGRDNALGIFAKEFSADTDLFQDNILDQATAAGSSTVLIRVTGYNGTANDNNVDVAVFVSDGLPTNDAGVPNMPNWDGNDPWSIDPGSLFGGVGPPYIPIFGFEDTHAYVTGSTLVATLNFPLVLGGGGAGYMRFVLNDATLTATIAPALGSYQLENGQIVGRLPASTMLAAIGGLDPVDLGSYICPGTQIYADSKTFICAGADINAAPSLDNHNAPCDAFSVAVGFTSYPAVMGAIAPASVPPVYCPDAGIDTCPTDAMADAVSEVGSP